MIALLLALAQGAAPAGDVRVTRESDPSAVCMVTTALESLKTSTPIQAVDQKPIIVRNDGVTTVTWKDARSGGKRVEVVCQANVPARQVTSITIQGKEILSAPQPF